MATKDVGATSGLADVAQSQLQDTRGTHDGVTNRMLGLAHTPDDGAGAVFVQPSRYLEQLLRAYATGFLDFIGRPLGQDFFFDFVHTVDTVVDVFFVFPAVLENDVQQTKQEGDV